VYEVENDGGYFICKMKGPHVGASFYMAVWLNSDVDMDFFRQIAFIAFHASLSLKALLRVHPMGLP
jgi:hypothetical protein